MFLSFRTVEAFNNKIATAVRGGQLKACLDLYEKMVSINLLPNTLTYELIISAYVGTPAARNANRMFSEMLNHNLAPTHAIYEKLITINAKDPVFCDKIYAHMRTKSGLAPSADIARAVVHAYFKHSRNNALAQRRAREILDDLLAELKRSSSSSSSYSTPLLFLPPDIFNALMEHSSEDDASELYASMIAHGVRPDATTFNTLLSKNQGKGEARQVREDMILTEMGAQNVQFNLVTYNVLISNAAKRRDLPRATQLYQLMKDNEIEGDIVTYQQLTVLAARMGEYEYCWGLLAEMKKKGWS